MTHSPIVAIDFDNTLVELLDSGHYILKPGAAEAIQALKNKGCTIVIHTCRIGIAKGAGNIKEVVDNIQSILDQFDIPFDMIHMGTKVVADAYIDDRAVAFTGDWDRTRIETEKLIFENQVSLRD